MVGTAYNLKKYLKFTQKKTKSKAEEVKASLPCFFVSIRGLNLVLRQVIFNVKFNKEKIKGAYNGLKHIIFCEKEALRNGD